MASSSLIDLRVLFVLQSLKEYFVEKCTQEGLIEGKAGGATCGREDLVGVGRRIGCRSVQSGRELLLQPSGQRFLKNNDRGNNTGENARKRRGDSLTHLSPHRVRLPVKLVVAKGEMSP